MPYSNFQKTIVLAIGLLASAFLISYIALAWTGPGTSPPGGNVPPPINVGEKEQVKSGRMGIGVDRVDGNYQLTVGSRGIKITNIGTQPSLYIEDQLGDSTPFLIDADGNVGIGTREPKGKFHVVGAIPLMSDDFDPSIDFSQWSEIKYGYSLPNCKSVSGERALYFTGGQWWVPVSLRYAATKDLDVSSGGYIEFYIRGCQKQTIPEGREVDLEYSTDGGMSWIKIATFSLDEYYEFTFFSIPIPSKAKTDSTRFRWVQKKYFSKKKPWKSNKWALDDVVIKSLGGRPPIIFEANVGIDTINPEEKLDIENGEIQLSGGYGIDWADNPWGGGGDDAWIRYIQRGSGGESGILQIGISNDPDDTIAFWQNRGERMTIADGKVGIGTTWPHSKLHVVGGLCVEDSYTPCKVPAGEIKVDKLTVDTIDPVYEINGKKYATYVSDFAGGIRVETGGILKLSSSYTIDFDNLEEGSDLWLFWQVSNKEMNDLVVILTPGFDGRVWYNKEENKLTIYANQPGEISYRLILPRKDYKDWGNIVEE